MGGYTGDGNDNVQIDQLGFQPDVVVVKGNTTEIGVIRTSTMVGNAAKPMTGGTALASNLIQSLDLRAFTVGTDPSVNGTGTSYFISLLSRKPPSG